MKLLSSISAVVDAAANTFVKGFDAMSEIADGLVNEASKATIEMNLDSEFDWGNKEARKSAFEAINEMNVDMNAYRANKRKKG